MIADAALELVEQTGDVQMVSLARHLGVAPSSLYGDVRGRDEVIVRGLESILDTSPSPPSAPPPAAGGADRS